MADICCYIHKHTLAAGDTNASDTIWYVLSAPVHMYMKQIRHKRKRNSEHKTEQNVSAQ